jgi:molybdopterin/thiamine biosynthesis adenylyltransferase
MNPDDDRRCSAVLLDADDDDALAELRADPRLEFLDRRNEQLDGLRQLRSATAAELVAEPTRWAYYPWRRTVVGVLGPRGFRALRLDRNRSLITAEEQTRLAGLRVGVAGLSVGHAIAHTLAMQGCCGMLRLTDFDRLELSNLNRVPATVLDFGVNKAIVAARRIAELDPYLQVEVDTTGLTPESMDDFLDGLDVVVEECDSFAMKVMVRESARARRLPVVMATSDRGLIDVERYDLDPGHPVMHGLLGSVDSGALMGLGGHEMIPHMLHHLDAGRSSPRFTASLVEVGQTLSSWPQLAGEVTLGAAAIAECVRRIGLGEPLRSGRVRIDIGAALDHLAQPDTDDGARRAARVGAADDKGVADDKDNEAATAQVVAAAAIRAPSGGNAQPWTIETRTDSVTIRIAPDRKSLMDVAHRGSAVALGAAMFNARVAAAAHQALGPVVMTTEHERGPLEAVLKFEPSADPELAKLYQPMLARETNRHHGIPQAIDGKTVAALHELAHSEGARLHLLTSRPDIEAAAALFAAADRIRYLTPTLHQELIAELRWPGDEPADTGVEVRSLELDATSVSVLEILRRADVMVELAQWNAGAVLGDDIRQRVNTASALAVITVAGSELTDFARGGAAAEAVWIHAQQQGLAVQPISPVFLHAVHTHELGELSVSFAAELADLQTTFRQLAATEPGESQVLVLKLAHAGSASVRSRRRTLAQVSPTATEAR